jgi:hypothetical protein
MTLGTMSFIDFVYHPVLKGKNVMKYNVSWTGSVPVFRLKNKIKAYSFGPDRQSYSQS